MKKYVKRIACGIIAAIMMFALVSCGGNDLKDVIIGTWDVPWDSDDCTFRNDGSIEDSYHDKYEIDGNMLYLYYTNADYDFPDEEEDEVEEDFYGEYYVTKTKLNHVYEVEIISNDSLKLIEINDDGTKDDETQYMDRIS